MQINGIELEFHLFDPDFKVQKDAYFAMLNQIKDSVLEEDSDKQIKKECSQVKQLFDVTFEAGTGERVCGKGNDHLACLEAYAALVNEQIRQCERYSELRDKLSEIGS